MADLAITPANVQPTDAVNVNRDSLAGEGVAAGDLVYRKSTDGRWWQMQCDGTNEEAGIGVEWGVAQHAAFAGQPLVVQQGGDIVIGATVAVGAIYVVSAAKGKIAPDTDLASTNKVTIFGFGLSATTISIRRITTGVSKP